MSMGTPESAKSPTLVTKAAGASAAPEKYSFQNHRASTVPGVRNRTSVASNRTPGAPAKAPRNGPMTANAVIPESTTQASNHRTLMRPLPTISSARHERPASTCAPSGTHPASSLRLRPQDPLRDFLVRRDRRRLLRRFDRLG